MPYLLAIKTPNGTIGSRGRIYELGSLWKAIICANILVTIRRYVRRAISLSSIECLGLIKIRISRVLLKESI